MELSPRKKQILKAIIGDYILTAEPVGSKALSGRPELNYSSATIRNEMSELEEMGYLEKPHTSAGRVPSPSGYRLYVDELMGLPTLPPTEAANISKVMQLKIKELDKMLSQAGKLISELTQYTTVALTPAMNEMIIKKFEIVAVDETTFVIVVVTRAGVVKNKLIRTAVAVTGEEASLLTYVLNQTLTGIPIDEITPERFDIVRRAAGVSALLAPIAEYLAELVGESGRQQLFVEGASKLLAYPEYQDAHKAQALLDYISDNHNLASLASYRTEVDGVQIAIGPGAGQGPASDASMVYATYNIGKIGQGIIGVVGPSRMNYANVSARLSLFAKELNKLIANTFLNDDNDEES